MAVFESKRLVAILFPGQSDNVVDISQAGEKDIVGFPKEGMQLSDLAVPILEEGALNVNLDDIDLGDIAARIRVRATLREGPWTQSAHKKIMDTAPAI